MGKEPQDDEDWLGFDKLAKMLGELPEDDSPEPQAPADSAAETPIVPEKPPSDQGPAPEE